MSEHQRSAEGPASDVRQLLKALLVTLISGAMLLGSFLLARLDTPRPPSMPTQAIARRSTITPFLPTLTPEPSVTASLTQSQPTEPPPETTKAEPAVLSPTPTLDQTPAPTSAPACTKPPGWFLYTVRRGDTMVSLARRSGTTMQILMSVNCLGTTALVPGQHLYVPPAFYATPTPEPYPCGPPMHWIIYYVQRGDTLYSLARRFNVDVETLRRANCLKSTAIVVGQPLYVPPMPVTPWPTATPTSIPSPSATPTRSATPTPTTPAATSTATPTSSFTPPPSPTPTTPLPTATQTPTRPFTSTPTPSPTAMTSPTPTPTSTSTLPPTATATPTATEATSTPTATSLPTQTSTPLPTATSTPLPTSTPTPSPSPSPNG